MIEVQQLTKTFHDKKRGVVHALDGISFKAAAGEIFGLLGPNGAGKTTTLRLLSTILRPTSGTATVGGADVVRNAQKVREQIGFASGDMGQYGRLSPRETLSFFGQLNGLAGARLKSRVDQVISEFAISKFADAKTDTLSTGMKQKVAIARTVVHDPPVLILDEPSAGLDVPAARLIEEFMLSAKRSGKCILFSTHVMEEAEYLCDRVAVVNQGQLKAIGTMDELRQRTGKLRLREIFLDLLGLSEFSEKARA